MESEALFAAMLVLLLGPHFSFQVVKTFLSLTTLHAPALEMVLDCVVIQNTMVLRVHYGLFHMLPGGKQGRVPLGLFWLGLAPAPVLMHCINCFLKIVQLLQN